MLRLFFLYGNGFLLKPEDYLKQVAVYGNLHGTSLQLGKTLGNCQAESAAFRISGIISSDKTFRQLFRGDGQLRCRNILQLYPHIIAFIFQIDINPGPTKGVFDDIAVQIVKDPVGFLAVQRKDNPFLWQVEFKIQPGGFNTVILFQISLP